MAKAAWPSYMVLMLMVVVAVSTAARGLDVVKTRQDGTEALVVRDGAVAPSFSVEVSMLAPDLMPWPFLSSIFSPFPRLYEEHAPQSHFLVRHHSPIEVTNFGVVDGLGQISRTDPSLKVSATFKSSPGASRNKTENEKVESEWYVYHLELDYECLELDPVKRLVVVQLREQAADALSDEQVAKAPELTFLFRKRCPLPRPPREWTIVSLFTTWSDALRGGSLLVASSSSSLDNERIDDLFRRPVLMVMVDDVQQKEAYGHERAPAKEQHDHQIQRPEESARREMLSSFFNLMPLWFSDALVIIGLATIIIAAVMLVVDILKALVGGGDEGGDVEDGADGEEVEPLLAHGPELDSTEPAEQLQHQLAIETEKLAEEAVKPYLEALAKCTQEAPLTSAEQLQQTNPPDKVLEGS